MKKWFINLGNGAKGFIHFLNAIVFIAIPIAIEGTTNVPLMLLWLANLVIGIIFIVWHSKANKEQTAYIQTEEGQAKVDNAYKLLKIAQANRVNPYADITPMELGIGFPFVDYDGFFCSGNELLVFACPANVFKDREQIIGYQCKSTGASVRVAKGLYMRSGGSTSSAVRAEVRKYYNGDLIITNKRIVFIGKDESFECPVEKITATKLLSKNGFVLQYGAKSKNIGVDVSITDYAYGMINYVVKGYKNGEDVFNGINETQKNMSAEQLALCESIRKETEQMKTPKAKTPKGCAVVLCVVIALIVIGCVCIAKFGIPNENKEPTTPEEMEFSLSQYDSTETEIEVGQLDSITFYVLPFKTTQDDLEIVNSNDEVATCTFKSVHAVSGKKLAIINIKGKTEGVTTLYLKEKNGTIQSCSIQIKVIEKIEEVDNSRTVYVNYSGDKYHFSKSCAGNSATETTLNKAKKMGKDPCSKCAH